MLGNGLRVASEDAGGAVATIEFVFLGGSAADAAGAPGTAFVVQELAFGATQQRSALKLFRDIENFGGRVRSRAHHESVTVTVEALRDELPLALEALSETLLQPRLAPWDVSESRSGILQRASFAREDGHVVLSEALQAAAD